MLEQQVQGDLGGFWAWVILAAIVFGAVVMWRKRKDKNGSKK